MLKQNFKHSVVTVRACDCVWSGLTTQLLHEANVPVGIEGQSVWSYTQAVEEMGGPDALQGQNTLHTDGQYLLLRQATVPQWEDVCQWYILLWTHPYIQLVLKIIYYTYFPHMSTKKSDHFFQEYAEGNQKPWDHFNSKSKLMLT